MSSSSSASIKTYCCLACHRLFSVANPGKCPFCHEENSAWQNLKGLDHLKRFPTWFHILLALDVIFSFLILLLARAEKPSANSSPLAPVVATLLAMVVAGILALVVFGLKSSLRDYELLRQVRIKPRRPSLVAYAILSAVAAFAFVVGAVVLLWLAVKFAPRGKWTLNMLSVENQAVLPIVENQGQLLHPSWSPDGKTLAFASNKEGNWDIYTIGLDQSVPNRLTNNAETDWAPSWSGDGTRIAFASNRNGPWEIWAMDPSGHNLQKLGNRPVRPTDLIWSPGDKAVAFVEATPSFSIWLGDQLGSVPKISRTITVLLAGSIPLVTLAIMLLAVKSYTGRLDNEFPRPIYLDTNKLAPMALRSVEEHLQTGTIGVAPGGGAPSPPSANGQQVENLRIISMSRTDDGGLQLTVGRRFEVGKPIEGSPDSKLVPEEKRYDVEVNEWGYIRSLKEKER